jgi:thiol-disulfide isomerase/thioredoxin
LPMKMRWVALALATAALIMVLAWLPIRSASSGVSGTAVSADAAQTASRGSCASNAPPADLSFTLKDMNGRDVKLSSFKGKVVLINFWATWCSPCKIEIPGFIELQGKYQEKGLVILGISIDDPIEKLPPFAQEFKMNYVVLVGRDREDVQNAYGPIYGVPTSYLIGRDGKICARHIGFATKEQFEKEIRAML